MIRQLIAALNRLAAAVEESNRLAARTPRVEIVATPAVGRTAPAGPRLPEPKGYQCAAGCSHSASTHREGGCDVLIAYDTVCPCTAPYGRIMPGDPAPDDISSLTKES